MVLSEWYKGDHTSDCTHQGVVHTVPNSSLYCSGIVATTRVTVHTVPNSSLYCSGIVATTRVTVHTVPNSSLYCSGIVATTRSGSKVAVLQRCSDQFV